MKRPVLKFLALAVSTLLAGGAAAENKFDYCLLCHGANGNGNYGIRAPKISGMESWYLARQLDNFAAGIRGLHANDEPGHEMAAIDSASSEDSEARVHGLNCISSHVRRQGAAIRPPES